MSDSSGVHYRTFVLLLVVVTIAFGWLLWPFYGAVFWGTILAILFAPLQRRLVARIGGGRNLAALITLLATASGFSFWGIGSAFWGLVAGLLAHTVFEYKRKPAA